MLVLKNGKIYNESQIEKVTPMKGVCRGGQELAFDAPENLWVIHFISGTSEMINGAEKLELENKIVEGGR